MDELHETYDIWLMHDRWYDRKFDWDKSKDKSQFYICTIWTDVNKLNEFRKRYWRMQTVVKIYGKRVALKFWVNYVYHLFGHKSLGENGVFIIVHE